MFIKATGLSTKSAVTVNTPGTISELTRGIGLTTICTDKVFTNGQMAESTKVTT